MSTWPSHQQQQQQQALKPMISPLSPNQQQQPQSPSNILLTSKLLRHITIDQPYELDKQWTAFLKSVDELVSNCTETEAVNKLHERLGDVKNKHAHTEICLGLMFGILIAPDMNKVQFYWKLLNHCVRDGFELCKSQLIRLIHEKYYKLLDSPLERIVWFVGELIKLNANDMENLCTLLLRQIITGDFSQRNLWLTGAILSMLHSNKKWTFSHRRILCTSTYTYLRLIEDQSTLLAKNNSLTSLRQKSIQFCTEAIREKFLDVITIGRDFARVLHQLAFKHKIPEMESIWKDLVLKPQQTPTSQETATSEQKEQPYLGLNQILSTPTRPRFLSSRVSSEMERELSFIMTNVKMGNQRRYQLWFQQRFLNNPESDMLIVDLIRYICCVFHPPNQILAGNFTPRWAMIGWLLKSLKSQQFYENAKFALIFDWLFCNKKENIMNLEPAMLLMVHSIPKYMDITSTILDAIFTNLETTTPYMGIPKETLVQNVQRASEIIVGSGVVTSFLMLSECTKLDQSLRDKCRKYFPKFTQLPPPQQQQVPPPHLQQNASTAASTAHVTQPGLHPPINPVKLPSAKQVSPVNVQPPVFPQVLQKTVQPSSPTVQNLPGAGTSSPVFGTKSTAIFESANQTQQKLPTSEAHARVVEEPSMKIENKVMEESIEKSEEASVIAEPEDEMRDISDDEAFDVGLKALLENFIQSSIVTKGKFPEVFENPIKRLGRCAVDYLEHKKNAKENCKQALSNVLDLLEKNPVVNEQTIQQTATFIMRLISIEFICSPSSNMEISAANTYNDVLEQQVAQVKKVLLFADQTIFYFMLEHIFKVVMNVLSNKEEKQQVDLKQPAQKRRISKESKQAKDRLALFIRHAFLVEPSFGFRALCYCIRKLHSKEFEESFFQSQDSFVSSLAAIIMSSTNLQQKGPILTFYEWLLHIRKSADTSESIFLLDLRNCVIENPSLFVAILPIVSQEMSHHIRRTRIKIYKLLASYLYPSHIQTILSLVRIGKIQILFAKPKIKKQPEQQTPPTPVNTNTSLVDEAISIIEKSFSWESLYEQDILWELLTSEISFQQKLQMKQLVLEETGDNTGDTIKAEKQSTASRNTSASSFDSKNSSQNFSLTSFIAAVFAMPGFENSGKPFLDKIQNLVLSIATYSQMVRAKLKVDSSTTHTLDVLNYEAIKTILSLTTTHYQQFPGNFMFEYIQIVGGSVVEPIFTHILKLLEDSQQTQISNKDDILNHLLTLKQLETANINIDLSLSDKLFKNDKFMRQVQQLKEKWKHKKQQFFILTQITEGYDYSQKPAARENKLTKPKNLQQRLKSQAMPVRKSVVKRKFRKLPWDDDDEQLSNEEDDFIVNDDEVEEPATDNNEDEESNEQEEEEEEEEEEEVEFQFTQKKGPNKGSVRSSGRRRRSRRSIDDEEEEDVSSQKGESKASSSEDEAEKQPESSTRSQAKRKRQQEEEYEEQSSSGEEEDSENEDLEDKYLKDQKNRKRRR